MGKMVSYLRLSKEDEFVKDESNSISNQRELIRKYIRKSPELMKMEQIELKDDGYSGKNMERPAIQELLSMIKKGKVSCIIVKDISRFSRDYIETGKYMEQIFPFLGIRFISINDNYDSAECTGGIAELDVAFKGILYDFYSEDLSEKVNKDTIRKYVREGARVIPGSSTIHFDEISKKRIFQSIDNVTTTKKLLKDKYMSLKNKLGHVPSIMDFYEYGEVDPMLFINYAKTYDKFVRLVDSDYKIAFTIEEEAVLEFVSSLLVNGKRPHELLMIKMLIDHQAVNLDKFQKILKEWGVRYRKKDYDSTILVLNKEFLNTQSEKKKYANVEFFDKKGMQHQQLKRDMTFYKKLNKSEFQKELENLIEYGLKKYEDSYSEVDEDNLVLYQKYSRKDVCRILNWEKDDSSTIYGYRIKYNTCPIFVTYEKKEDIASSTKYEDQFVNPQIFSWMTRSKVSMNSPEAQELIHYQENGLKIYLFIKKSDGEGTDFYYMGKVKPVEWTETTIKNDKGQLLPIMNFQMELENGVRSDIYEYFTK